MLVWVVHVFFSSAGDVLEISGVRGVGGVCDMCMCLAWGGVEGVGVRGLGLGFKNPGGTGGKWDMCFGCSGVKGVGGRPGPGRVG